MAMRIADQVTLKLVTEGSDDSSPRSEFVLNSIPTGTHIEGATLEAAVEWNSYYLLFTTDDVPYEEMLRIVLLDPTLEVLDSALIGSPYSTGSFSSLELLEPDTVKFRFIGGSPWEVQLLSTRALRLPFFSEPRGVHRPVGFSRHFIVKGKPSPETGAASAV
jgi:hypothetical protein